MCVDIADVFRSCSGPRQCPCHAQACPMPAGLRAHDMVRVPGHAVAANLHSSASQVVSYNVAGRRPLHLAVVRMLQSSRQMCCQDRRSDIVRLLSW